MNYYSMNPKTAPFFLDQKITPFGVLYITLDSTKTVKRLLGILLIPSPSPLPLYLHMEGREKYILKMIASRNPDLTQNT